MDPLSIASGCAGLVSAIGSLSYSIHAFVRTCREARSDLDRVSRELLSLQTVLELIQEDVADDATAFPQTLERHVSSIVLNCNLVVTEIQECITKYSSDNRLKVKASWAINGQGDIAKLRSSLEAHKAALELALDMFTLHVTKDIKNDTTEIHKDTTAIKEDTAQILAEIARLQERLPKQVENDYILQHFLEEMTTYTEQTLHRPYNDGRSPSPTFLRPDFDPPDDVHLEDSERTAVSRPESPWNRRNESQQQNLPTTESTVQAGRSSPQGIQGHGTSSDNEQGLEDIGPVNHEGPSPTDNHTPTSLHTHAIYSSRPDVSKSSINNPKLLETVDDAIRRLILPELNALKRESNKREGRRDSFSSVTSISMEESTPNRGRSSGQRSKTKGRRNREARHVLKANSDLSRDSVEDKYKYENEPFKPKRNGGDALKAPPKPTEEEVCLSYYEGTTRGRTLVINYPVATSIRNNLRDQDCYESTHTRFTAVACTPRGLEQLRHPFRPRLFAKPRHVAIVFVLEVTGRTTYEKFMHKWNFAATAISQARQRVEALRENLPQDYFLPWQHTIVLVHFPSNSHPVSPEVRDFMTGLGVQHHCDDLMSMIGRTSLNPPLPEDQMQRFRESITATIHEYTVQPAANLHRPTLGLPGTEPLQVISVTDGLLGYSFNSPLFDVSPWISAICTALDTQFIVKLPDEISIGSPGDFLWEMWTCQQRFRTSRDAQVNKMVVTTPDEFLQEHKKLLSRYDGPVGYLKRLFSRR